MVLSTSRKSRSPNSSYILPTYSWAKVIILLGKSFIDIDRLLNSSLLRTCLVGVFFKEQFSVGFVIVVYHRFLGCCVYIVNPFYLYCNIKLKYFLFCFLIRFFVHIYTCEKWQPTRGCQAKMLYTPQYKNY